MKALYYFKRALSLPPHVVVRKVAYKLKKKFLLKRKKYLDGKFPTYSNNFACLKLNSFVKKVDSSLLPAVEINKLNMHYLKHEFDLLGSGWVSVFQGMNCLGLEGFHYSAAGKGEVNEKNRSESKRICNLIRHPYQPIDWHLDFKSGFRWNEETWSQHIQYGVHLGVDVKVPWELSRMQHLVMLAWGYALEGRDLYLSEFQNQILDFIASNPPRFGVNWVCTMDVGIRIANWLIAYDLFAVYGAKFNPEFEKVFFRSVYEHGLHIYNHLEWDPHLRSNHYLANIAGLLFVSAYLPLNPEIRAWFDFAVRELVKEVSLQFHADGSNFEASTSYHRLSAEMVVYATALALEKQVQFPEEYLKRLEKMGDFIRDITKPDGTIVQFGDNDSGRFIKMFPDDHLLDHRYLIRAIRDLGSLNSVIQGQLSVEDVGGRNLSVYPDFGLHIQKMGPWFLAIRCGSIGQNGNGGHAHNDQLSFELSVNGISMIIDPGTYVYTPIPKARRHFRSTAMHNTLAIESKEQNQDQGLFKMGDRTNAKLIQFQDGVFVGEHVGFGPIHRRTLKLFANSIEGIDECDAGSKQIYFHLAPNWKLSKKSEFEINCTSGTQFAQISAFGFWTIEAGLVSYGYGEKMKAQVLKLTTNSKRAEWKIQT